MEKSNSIDVLSGYKKVAERAYEIILNNLTDPDFNLDRLSDEMGVAKVRLHRQLLAGVGVPPATFIRKIRLHAAEQHIRNSYGNVSQIMYAVGFTNLSTFIAAFKKEFGMTPKTMIHNWLIAKERSK